ncbi:MAG: hypothetical protein NT120_00495 [Candidatus Aenigmarchaeota archaeon]|nr:hypothetical protein [Candidatus Aenigmarchaeota archaeon]
MKNVLFALFVVIICTAIFIIPQLSGNGNHYTPIVCAWIAFFVTAIVTGFVNNYNDDILVLGTAAALGCIVFSVYYVVSALICFSNNSFSLWLLLYLIACVVVAYICLVGVQYFTKTKKVFFMELAEILSIVAIMTYITASFS